MKKYLIFSLVGLAVVALTASTAFAYQGGFARNNVFSADMTARHEAMTERREAMQNVFVDGDYATWQAQMQERVSDMRNQASELEAKISEDSFAKLQEAHELMVAGDFAGAQAIHEELGWGDKRGFSRRGPGGPGEMRPFSQTEE